MSNTDWLAAASALLLAFLGLRWLRGFLARPRAQTAPIVQPAALSRAQQDTLRTLALQGQKIAAVKQLRELTGMGLREAVDYIEALADPARPPGAAPTDPFAASASLPLSRAQDDELRAMLARKEKIAAIKRVRELTAVGLKEAKDYVESLEGAGAFSGGNWPAPQPPDPVWGAAPSDPGPAVADEVRRRLGESGGKIAAIKYVREQTGLGLKEAKDYVESLERQGW